MREADAGDCYLAYLDAADRRLDSEYRALARALMESALADIWCVRLGDLHQTRHGKRIDTIYAARREPMTRSERANRRAALAWMNGAPGTAEEPLRWVDVCEALDMEPVSFRRIILARMAADARRPAPVVGWQPQAVTA